MHAGMEGAALRYMEQAYRNREYELLVAKAGYGFDSFRSYPRFQSVVENLGLR